MHSCDSKTNVLFLYKIFINPISNISIYTILILNTTKQRKNNQPIVLKQLYMYSILDWLKKNFLWFDISSVMFPQELKILRLIRIIFIAKIRKNTYPWPYSNAGFMTSNESSLNCQFSYNLEANWYKQLVWHNNFTK